MDSPAPTNPSAAVDLASPALLRRRAAESMAERPLDVLVIGGGIVGAGVARDAAMRGLRVGLVEQGDFASGTSSRSSRLLHGGLRYLAQGHVGLVFQAGREKRILSRIAPHLYQPLPFLFPAYGDGKWSLGKLQLGVQVYDLLSGSPNATGSDWLDRGRTEAAISGVRSHKLAGAVRYFDAFTNDARLVIDTLRSAARHGALLLNYAKLAASWKADTGGWFCQVADLAGGGSAKSIDVTAACVVNASGPWSPQLPRSRVRLRLTKGVHLVIDRRRLPIREAVVMSQGLRILFALPWGNRVILGTTDTDYAGSPDDVATDADDVRYVLDVANHTFPGANLRAANVLADWAGVRPLISSGEDAGPSEISRAHVIRGGKDGWIDVAGGKLTTYRLIAEEVVDRAAKLLGRRLRKCATASEPLIGHAWANGVSGILPPAVSKQVVERFCHHEWAMTLEDVMVRRSSWRYYLDDAEAIVPQVAAWMAGALGWDAARTAEEAARYQRTRRG